MANAGERLDRRRWRSVQFLGRVAETGRYRASHFEVVSGVRLERDLRVHVLDSTFEIRRIHNGSTHGGFLQAA
jgi:hypothetical protein